MTTTTISRLAMVRCPKCELFTLKDVNGSFKGNLETLRQYLSDSVAVGSPDASMLAKFAWKVSTQQDGNHCLCHGHSTMLRHFAERYVAAERARENGKETPTMKNVWNGKHNAICGKCCGMGYIPAHQHRADGTCFACNGTGKNPWYIGPEPKVETKAKVKTLTREEWEAKFKHAPVETVLATVTLEQKDEQQPAADVVYREVQTKAGVRVRVEDASGKFLKWASKAEIANATVVLPF